MDFLDLVFPKKCVTCGREGSYFCPKCLVTVKRVKQICPVCGGSTPFGQAHPFCGKRDCPDGLISLFAYTGVIKDAIHKLKYKFVTDLENEFWEIVKNDLEKRGEELVLLRKFISDEKPVVVPIPLHRLKENHRGFNQSSLFGKRIANLWGLPFSDKILIRRKNVPSQTKLTKEERGKNVREIFRFSPIIHNSYSYILLIDDVWTTGATMKEATRVLKEGGAKKVWGMTIAR